MKRLAAPSALALLASLLPSPATAQAMTKEDVARILRIAAMTEWVTRECDRRHVAELEGMLLMTSRSALRVADAADVERFRAAVRQQVRRFKSKDEACSSATAYLKSVQ
jgi:hypothetical protein